MTLASAAWRLALVKSEVAWIRTNIRYDRTPAAKLRRKFVIKNLEKAIRDLEKIIVGLECL